MSNGIKRMLAEQAMATPSPIPFVNLPAEDEALLARIDVAAPYIDEGCGPRKWPPSIKLKTLFFIVAGGDGGGRAAHRTVERLLEKARRRWLAGEHPNPF